MEDDGSAGTFDRGLGYSIACYSLDARGDFDRYGRLFHGSYLMRSVSDGRRLVRRFLILVCARRMSTKDPT